VPGKVKEREKDGLAYFDRSFACALYALTLKESFCCERFKNAADLIVSVMFT
jgi:hypothetical protein